MSGIDLVYPPVRGCERREPPAKKLHIFDMDGTLLRGNACLRLSHHAGALETVLEIERRWGAGEVGHVEFYDLCLPLWQSLTPEDVERIFDSSEWMAGMADVFADIDRRGEHAVVITGAPLFFARHLLRWGVCSVHGSVVEVGSRTELASLVIPDVKVPISRELMQHHGVRPEDCVAYADATSDVPLFRSMPHTVAVNATEALKQVAAAVYDGHDLREAYAAARALLDRSAG